MLFFAVSFLGVGTVKYVVCEPFHDGVRIYWQGHNYVDSIGITYALQMSRGDDEEFVNIYRGTIVCLYSFTIVCYNRWRYKVHVEV